MLPSELGFLRYLADARVPLNEYQFPQSKVANVQSQVSLILFSSTGICCERHILQIEKLLQKNYYLYQSAREGYRAYLHSYASYSLKKIFDISKLDLVQVGKAFGFLVPPRIELGAAAGTKRKRAAGDGSSSDSETDGAKYNHGSESGRKEREQRRRKEIVGAKALKKDLYRKPVIPNTDAAGQQWSR